MVCVKTLCGQKALRSPILKNSLTSELLIICCITEGYKLFLDDIRLVNPLLDLLNHIFKKKYITSGSSTNVVTEGVRQQLRLMTVNMRPLKQTQCLFILEFRKDSKNDELYMPLVMEYTVTLNGSVDDGGKRLANLIKMAFNVIIDYSSNDLVQVFGQLHKRKGKYIHDIIKHSTKIVRENGKIVYDDSIEDRELFGKHEIKKDHSAYIFKVSCIDKPFYSHEVNYRNLIDPPREE